MKMHVVFVLLTVDVSLLQRLAHQARLQADPVVAHVALDLRFRRERGHGVDHQDVDRRRADKLVGYLESLLAVVRLRDQQVVDVHAELRSIEAVEGVLRVDERPRCRPAFCASAMA